MKRLITTVFVSLCATTASAESRTLIQEAEVLPQVPGDADVLLALRGEYPDGCTKITAITASKDEEKRLISLDAKISTPTAEGQPCADGPRKFEKIVSLGFIAHGNWKLEVTESGVTGLRSEVAVPEPVAPGLAPRMDLSLPEPGKLDSKKG